MLFHLKESKEWPKQRISGWQSPQGDAETAFDFLAAARCFLHFRHNRDDNTLDWQSQDEAAAQSIGLETRGTADPAYWMRTYYRYARTVYRRAVLLMEHLPAPVSFYKQFRKRRVPIQGTDFSLDQGRIDISPTAQFADTDGMLCIFALISNHGYTLTQAAEDRIIDALPVPATNIPEGPYLWNHLREVLLGPHAAHALRTMQFSAFWKCSFRSSSRHRCAGYTRYTIAIQSMNIPFSPSTTFRLCDGPCTNTNKG